MFAWSFMFLILPVRSIEKKDVRRRVFTDVLLNQDVIYKSLTEGTFYFQKCYWANFRNSAPRYKMCTGYTTNVVWLNRKYSVSLTTKLEGLFTWSVALLIPQRAKRACIIYYIIYILLYIYYIYYVKFII